MKKFLPLLLLGIFFIQLYVPASLVFESERAYALGREYRMELAPIDPEDPFRGKYLVLRFKENTYTVPANSSFQQDQQVFVLMRPDNLGYLKIENVGSVYSEMPNLVAIPATIQFISEVEGQKQLVLEYPFSRFYMDEFRAPEVEKQVQNALRDSSGRSYGLIGVREKQALLKDVMLNGRSVRELASPSVK